MKRGFEREAEEGLGGLGRLHSSSDTRTRQRCPRSYVRNQTNVATTLCWNERNALPIELSDGKPQPPSPLPVQGPALHPSGVGRGCYYPIIAEHQPSGPSKRAPAKVTMPGKITPSRNALSSGSRDPAQSREATRPPHGSLSSNVKHKFDQRLPHSVRRLTSCAPKRHEYAPILLSPIGT
jgi:hypothetical protein